VKRRLGLAFALALFTFSTAFAADPALLALLPADAKAVAGMNVDRAANSPFGQFLLSQMKSDDAGFRKFVTATGFDPRRDLREVIAAGTMVPNQRGHGLVVARGTFNGPLIIAAAKTEGATISNYKGVEVVNHKADSPSFAIIDGNITIAGEDALVKRAIDQRGGGVVIDPKIAAKANDVSGRFDAWAVSTAPLGNFAGAAPSAQAGAAMKSGAMQNIEQTSGGVRFGTMVEIVGEALTRSDKDALALVDVIRFVAGLMQTQREKNPQAAQFAALLDSMEVKAAASTVHVSLSIAQAEIEKLIKPRRAAKRSAALRVQ
jgi:hypothetical protein